MEPIEDDRVRPRQAVESNGELDVGVSLLKDSKMSVRSGEAESWLLPALDGSDCVETESLLLAGRYPAICRLQPSATFRLRHLLQGCKPSHFSFRRLQFSHALRRRGTGSGWRVVDDCCKATSAASYCIFTSINEV